MINEMTNRANSPASKSWMRPRIAILWVAAVVTGAACAQTGASASSQVNDPRAKQMIQAIVRSELAAADNDHSVWTFRDHDKTSDKDVVYRVIDTPAGELRRMTELGGRPVDPHTAHEESERIAASARDTYTQAKQRRAGAHDDAQARQMLQMLPNAYIWSVKNDSGELTTLAFRPDPNFRAPDLEARVMATMAGELVVAKSDNRIRSLRGALTDDVKFGYGLFGKLRKGGMFDVERREIAPHIWQITETHVHIDGRALLFKTIGQQEDEVKTEWKPSTAKTLQDAAKQLSAD